MKAKRAVSKLLEDGPEDDPDAAIDPAQWIEQNVISPTTYGYAAFPFEQFRRIKTIGILPSRHRSVMDKADAIRLALTNPEDEESEVPTKEHVEQEEEIGSEEGRDYWLNAVRFYFEKTDAE